VCEGQGHQEGHRGQRNLPSRLQKETLGTKQTKISGDFLKTQPNIKRIIRQRNLAGLSALLLMAGIAATAASSADAASTTYICVNKSTSQVYLKTKCAMTERRVAFKTVTIGTNGTDGSAGPTGPAGPAGATGATGATGPSGSSPSLPFFQRLETGLTCDEKWRTITTSVYATNQAGVDRQQALAGCPQPDWAKQYFQFPDANPISLVSTSYGAPSLVNQQIRRNGVLVDDLYAPKKTTVSFSAVVAIQPPTGWAVCADADAQITALGETGYPKLNYEAAADTYSYSIANNRATVTGSFSVVNTDQLRTSFYDLWLNTYICGPDASTPSGLGRKTVSVTLFLPAVNP
jgi:hypothetical protein